MLSDDYNLSMQIKSDGFHLEWSSVVGLANLVRFQLEDSCYFPKVIIALGKGAMVPARLIADNRPVFYLGLQSYDDQQQKSIAVTQSIPYDAAALNKDSTLLVDDLWDSGETIRFAKTRWPLARTATLLSKKPVDDTCLDYCGLELPTNSWIHFPWEVFD